MSIPGDYRVRRTPHGKRRTAQVTLARSAQITDFLDRAVCAGDYGFTAARNPIRAPIITYDLIAIQHRPCCRFQASHGYPGYLQR